MAPSALMHRIDPAELMDRIDPAELIERIEPAEHAESNEPAEKNDSADPTEPIERIDITDSTESSDHVDIRRRPTAARSRRSTAGATTSAPAILSPSNPDVAASKALSPPIPHFKPRSTRH